MHLVNQPLGKAKNPRPSETSTLRKAGAPRRSRDRLRRPQAVQSTALDDPTRRTPEQGQDTRRLLQSPTTMYVFLACSAFCIAAVAVVALAGGSVPAIGSISAVWAATCGVLGLQGRRES